VILSIDPGPELSAIVELSRPEGEPPVVAPYNQEDNEIVLQMLKHISGDVHVVIERIEARAQPFGWDTRNTCEWATHFYRRAKDLNVDVHWLTRSKVRTHLGGVVTTTATQVEQITMDRFGPGRRAAIGTAKDPGPLFCMSPKSKWKHAWAALALAITWEETHASQ
jgi:hypothetical protein